MLERLCRLRGFRPRDFVKMFLRSASSRCFHPFENAMMQQSIVEKDPVVKVSDHQVIWKGFFRKTFWRNNKSTSEICHKEAERAIGRNRVVATAQDDEIEVPAPLLDEHDRQFATDTFNVFLAPSDVVTGEDEHDAWEHAAEESHGSSEVCGLEGFRAEFIFVGARLIGESDVDTHADVREERQEVVHEAIFDDRDFSEFSSVGEEGGVFPDPVPQSAVAPGSDEGRVLTLFWGQGEIRPERTKCFRLRCFRDLRWFRGLR
ncbi:unnamed protein product [Darwinula stevensoni]|uniref:Uncharacterized protein n=1 Tax=Darwinula stevensoni TaxID=69355 RepID=A0A7R9FNR0_9CRUS|nr:unnamed protein product [Darwinula stevensoni]CAG0896730.1 unnamed protein product [Darwinula stevensoni]